MNLKQKLQYAVAGASVAIMSLPAMAEDIALVTAAKAELASAKDGVSSIGAVVIGVAAAMVVVGLIIKAVRKGG
ncbi:hypothetical protein [Neisseria sp. GT4A_CT1]|uniref:hypothetical protein n=1 Tax=Neisseria sp. GT4A_CT1 TaxID=665946 RepID=UPI00022BF3CF|nr:hypothetical protein [Neisseria sp. GT4A_CT1]EGY62469.1 hypothetical protein HMPREF1028_00541 [Neisseria sp. GT4A_CT1]